jgi:heme/copper-type cytochrome/quinol oxidase subunit 3
MSTDAATLDAGHAQSPGHAPDHGDAHDDHHAHALTENNFLGLPNLKLAMWAFLGSECMFFGSLIGTYFFYRDMSLGGPLPEDIFDVNITSISTFLLLMSSVTMALAVDNARQQKFGLMRLFILATAAQGASFVGFQIYEFSHFVAHGLKLSTSLFGSTFFTMTGFHGAHVTVGVIWLLMMALLVTQGKVKREKVALNVEVMGLYWHFVDIVWIIIFTFVYLLEFTR